MKRMDYIWAWQIAAGVVIIAFGATVACLLRLREPAVPRGLKRIPSPPGATVLGGHAHLYRLGTNNPSQSQFVKWAREYGEIYQIRSGSQRIVVLSSPEAVKEILDKHGGVTGSKPRFRVAQDILSGGYRMLFMPYGKLWRSIRSVTHQLLTAKNANTMKPSQDLESARYLYDLLTDPTKFLDHAKRYTSSVIMYAVYGRRVKSLDDQTLKGIREETKFFSDAVVTRFAVDQYPVLEMLPRRLQWWRKKYEELHQREVRLWLGLWNRLKKQLEAGRHTGCFAEKFMEVDYPKMEISEVQAAYIAGSMLEAGVDTTQLPLNSLILGLVAFPETVKAAHKELDEVGGGRMPAFEDSPNLPYIRAMVKEVLRWRSVTNDAIRHVSTADVVYKGYFIPKGSSIALCHWAIHYNPELYPNPERFDPSRFLGMDMTAGECINASDVRNRDHFAFGSGRRVCPGYHLAENSLFILTSRLLWAFDVQAPVDAATGRRLEVDVWNYYPTSLFGPKPFPAEFKLRSERKGEIIKETFRRGEKE